MGRKLRRVGMFENPPHVFPEGDQFLHTNYPSCPCRPQLDSQYVSGIGGAAWYQHRPMMMPLPSEGIDFTVPDYFDDDLLYRDGTDPLD